MTWPDGNHLHRTAKQLVDVGRANTQLEAEEMLDRFVLQIAVGAQIVSNKAEQAALLTAVNAGMRAFLGGVVVALEEDDLIIDGWFKGIGLGAAVQCLGGHLSTVFDSAHPTIVIGAPRMPVVGGVVMKTVLRGWAGGVVALDDIVQDRVQDRVDAIQLAGVAAGALGVSEAFQHCLGDVEAGRRQVGVSLWRPDTNWRNDDAVGPELSHLPSSFWILGLGHLGQAYAWAVGFLPYLNPSAVTAYLVDTDGVVRGNLATGLLCHQQDVGQLKTRVVSRRLEERGIRTRLVERRFDTSMRPAGDEPQLALAGFDAPVPRTLLDDGRFARSVDAGLGGTAADYLDMLLHSFPSNLDASSAFAIPGSRPRQLPAAYEEEISRRVAAGMDEGDARCGIIEVAGISVGAAFVGGVAGALVVGDALRYLHSGPSYSVISLDLRSPRHIRAIPNAEPGVYKDFGSTAAV